MSFTGVGAGAVGGNGAGHLPTGELFIQPALVLSIVPATGETEEMEEHRTWILSSGGCQSRREIFYYVTICIYVTDMILCRCTCVYILQST